MYSEIAEKMRRCTGANKDGSPCQAWALWGAPDQCCKMHTTWAYASNTFPAPTCRCEAYAWPHRPGGGLCQWPDVPAGCCNTKAGTHKPGKRRSKWKTTVERWSYDADTDPIEKLDEILAMLQKGKNR